MIIKKSGRKVFGAGLTKAEKQAMDVEIRRQLAEHDRKHSIELDALVLWILHDVFGFGHERLRRFYDEFTPAVEKLIKRYELDDHDRVWICTRMLKEYGVDIEAWREETKLSEG